MSNMVFSSEKTALQKSYKLQSTPYLVSAGHITQHKTNLWALRK